MAVRFRIRTSAGQELSFASHEIFEEFVRSGDLSPDDLVYDGETESWSPARTHPTVLEIEYEREAEAQRAAGEHEAPAAEPSGKEAAAGERLDPDVAPPAAKSLEFDLVPAEERSLDDDKRAFVEKMDAERESDLDRESLGPARIEGFTREDSSSLAGMLTPSPPPPAPKEPPRTPPPPGERRRRGRSRRTRRTRARSPGADPASAPKFAARSRGTGRRAARLVFFVLVIAGAGSLGYRIWAASPPAEDLVADPVEERVREPVERQVGEPARSAVQQRVPDPLEQREPEPVEEAPEVALDGALVAPEPMAVEGTAAPPAPLREPVIPANEAAVRDRARERYLAATQSALRDLQPIPDVWPEGRYLSLPTEHPEVVDVWQSYVATIRRVRADDEERYRASYEAALDDAVVEGEGREARLASALADFRASAGRRDRHFDRVESLATVAIQSHGTLSEIEGLILYDAGGDSGALGAGTTTRDAESRRVLDQVLSRLTNALHADGIGPREGERVREWVWDGFLDAAMR